MAEHDEEKKLTKPSKRPVVKTVRPTPKDALTIQGWATRTCAAGQNLEIDMLGHMEGVNRRIMARTSSRDHSLSAAATRIRPVVHRPPATVTSLLVSDMVLLKI